MDKDLRTDIKQLLDALFEINDLYCQSKMARFLKDKSFEEKLEELNERLSEKLRD